MITLREWGIKGSNNPYLPPESQTRHLFGEVYGHPRIEDGHHVLTSPIVKVEGRKVTTKSGNVYELGAASSDYMEWCVNNDTHLPVGDNPIKVKT
jgi:hypothetical protein